MNKKPPKPFVWADMEAAQLATADRIAGELGISRAELIRRAFELGAASRSNS
jgi:hypothetical protein